MKRIPLTFTPLFILSLFIALTGSSTHIAAFDSNRRLVVVAQGSAQGIELYKAGNITEAIKVLRVAVKQNKEDADAWHYLGLALLTNGAKNDARKAFEQAARLRIGNLYLEYPTPP